MNYLRTLPLCIAAMAMLSGCAATSHPDYEPVFYKQNVPNEKIAELLRRFRDQGLAEAKVSIDPLGRVQLVGSYDNERQVERAFAIAREVVGTNAVSGVRPEFIKNKDWEISASKGFAKFVEELAKKYKMSVQIEQKGTHSLIAVADKTLDGLEQFSTGASEPTAKAAQFYQQVAIEIANSESAKSGKKRIVIVGHTDDVGDSERNAALSERRAKAIGKIFESANISGDHVFYQGAGEMFPIADNRTEAGRTRNRRVEIVDLSDDHTFAEFLAARKPNVAFYRPAGVVPSRVTSKPSVAPSTNKPSTPIAKASPNNSNTAGTPVTTPNSMSTERPASSIDDTDFGGSPANGQFHSVEIGKMTNSGGVFSFISSAYAAVEAPVGSCAQDRPRISHGVKTLSTGTLLPYKTSDYLPGAAGYSWTDMVNGHLVGITKVAVLRDGGQPVVRPDVMVFKKYVVGSKAKPDFTTSADVNAYQGDKAMLYRVFLAQGPLRCIDMVIPNQGPNVAPNSNIIYSRLGSLYQVAFAPKIAR